MGALVGRVVAAGAMAKRDQPVLRAGWLNLRPWRLGDANVVRVAYGDPEIQRFNLRTVDSDSEAHGWIGQWTEAWLEETDACWAIEADDPLGGTGSVLGRVAIRNIDLVAGYAQVTYWVLPAARGRGAAQAATAAATRWAFEDLGLYRLELLHSIENPSSCRVASKAGFALEGRLRSAMLHTDGWHDMHLHGRLRTDPVL